MSEILGTLFKYLGQMIGVAAVGLVLWAVFGSSKTSNAISDLSQLQGNIQTLYSTQATFASVTTAVAVKLAPTRMINGTNLVNPWSGAVTVNVNASDPLKFDVNEAGVPTDPCSKMASNTPTAVGLSINNVAQTLPIDAGVAVQACNGTTNTLIFTYSH